MIINFSKSSAVLGVRGRKQQVVMHSKTRQWNGQQCLMIPTSSGTVNIPLNDTLLYLGTKLSYGKFEVQTAKHRAQQAHKLRRTTFSFAPFSGLMVR